MQGNLHVRFGGGPLEKESGDRLPRRWPTQPLKSAKAGHPHEPLRLVLVDDHFGSGTTALQAKQFLRDKLGPETKIVYFPMVSRRTKFLITVEDMLPYNYEDPAGRRVFSVTKDEFYGKLSTQASYFPYMGKDIVGE
jgi:hypothetical protein